MNARNKENSHNYALCFFLSDTTASTARSTSGRTRKTCPPFVPTSHQSSYSTTRPALTDHTQVLMDSISPISLILCFFQGFTLMSDMYVTNNLITIPFQTMPYRSSRGSTTPRTPLCSTSYPSSTPSGSSLTSGPCSPGTDTPTERSMLVTHTNTHLSMAG